MSLFLHILPAFVFISYKIWFTRLQKPLATFCPHNISWYDCAKLLSAHVYYFEHHLLDYYQRLSVENSFRVPYCGLKSSWTNGWQAQKFRVCSSQYNGYSHSNGWKWPSILRLLCHEDRIMRLLGKLGEFTSCTCLQYAISYRWLSARKT